MGETHVAWSLADLTPGEPLAVPLFLYLENRYILYRNRGDLIDRATFDRMEQKNISNLFVRQSDEAAMRAWAESCKMIQAQDLPISGELGKAREETRRSLMDIFHTTHANEIVTKTLKTSENLVTELMKFPFAAKPLAQLQSYSRGTVDHSVNVSVLSIFLAMNLGYNHVLILRHLAAGALLHDIGKSRIEVGENDTPEQFAERMKKHPEVAVDLFKTDETISKEVTMIVAQHHEFHDGSGYPKGLHGREIYDLAKIVAVANVFDGLVSETSGSLEERHAHAIEQLKGPYAHKFDPKKLQKIIKILSLGI